MIILCTVLSLVPPGLNTTCRHGTVRLLENPHVWGGGRGSGVPTGWNKVAEGLGHRIPEGFFIYLFEGKVTEYTETTTGVMLELVEVAPGRTMSIPPISVATSRPWSLD